MSNKFYKVGRIYWIKPIPIPGMQSKVRPGIVLEKYGKGKTIFLHLGSTEFKEPSSIKATSIFREEINENSFTIKQENSWIHLDASKPEWNTSIIKPHFKNGKYIDISNKSMKKLRGIYHHRKKELETIRYKKAQILIIKNKEEEALKQLILMKDKDPIKHKNLEPKEIIEKLKKNIESF